MIINRTTGTASIVPQLTYRDVPAAVTWLCSSFGFSEIWHAGDHRARIGYGNGVVVIADAGHGRETPADSRNDHVIMVKVESVDDHCRRAREAGAVIVAEPADHSYGERQYSAIDPEGHRWLFGESIADVAPEDWGGVTTS